MVVHTLTAFGAVSGFLALEAVFNDHTRRALVWLVVCQVLDGIDGPIARKLDVRLNAPNIDGHILDLVVDYVTCVVVPVVLMIHLRLVPSNLAIVMASLILVSSALWFARTDQETEDGWFRGFPGMWNIVVPSFVILDTSPGWVVAVCICAALLQLTSVEFPHILRAPALRPLTVAVTAVYFGAFIALSADYPNGNRFLRDVILVAPLYLAFIVSWRTFFPGRMILGRRIVTDTREP